MKVKAKFVAPAPLDTVPDSTDGEVVAIRPTAQTIKGLKTFKTMNVASDPGNGGKSLLNYGDLKSVLAGAKPFAVTEVVELTSEHISGKSITLQHPRLAGSLVRMKVEGSGWYFSDAHFRVVDSTISWAENVELCGKLSVGDTAHVRYTAMKG